MREGETRALPGLAGADVKRLRQVRGITLSSLAKATGLSMTKLSFIENGHDPMLPGHELLIVRALWPPR